MKNFEKIIMCLYLNIYYCQGQNYNGFHFKDNLAEERFTSDSNGYAVYHFDIPIPDSVISFKKISLLTDFEFLVLYLLQDLCRV